MAAIIASTFTLGHPQANGSRYVTETHTWDSGLPPTVLEYGPIGVVDYQSIADARAVQLMASAAEAEFGRIIGGSQ
jgi:hypothetical protein